MAALTVLVVDERAGRAFAPHGPRRPVAERLMCEKDPYWDRLTNWLWSR